MTCRWIRQFTIALAISAGGLATSLCVAAGAKPLLVGSFSAGNLQIWQEKQFAGKTDYTLSNEDGQHVLQATSKASASALFLQQQVDLGKTPYLSWSWMVEQPISGLDETKKAGDDYAARVYVVFAVGPFFWQKRSLTYVWSGGQSSGQSWPNAFTPNAQMLAVNDGSDAAGQWIHHKRNVREDIKKYFDLDVSRLEGVAIMTDTDNSGKRAVAWYGDLLFDSN